MSEGFEVFNPQDPDDWFEATLYRLLDHWGFYGSEVEAARAWDGFLASVRAKAWSEGHEAGRDYRGDGWNCDVHDPEGDNPYRVREAGE